MTVFLALLKSRPGDRDWAGYCEWARSFLWYDRDTGYVRYRPREAKHFPWLDDPTAMVRVWNAASANREVRIYRRGKFGAYIKVDGVAAQWSSIRQALGCHLTPDLNAQVPDPKDLTDQEVVARWGIDFALSRVSAVQTNDAKKARVEAAAITLLAQQMGRRITAFEKKVAKGWVVAVKPKYRIDDGPDGPLL